MVHLRVEQLVLHEQLADLGVQSLVLLIPGIRRAALQPRLARGQELVTPLGGPRRRDPQFPRHRLEILASQQAEYRRAFTPSRKPPLPVTLGGRSSRPPGALRRRRFFNLLLISTLPLRELSRNQVSKKTLGRRNENSPILVFFSNLLVLCVFVPLAFGQETTVWEYDTDLGAEIGHFEVTPLGSIFVGRPDRTVVLEEYTGEVIWERTDIRGCRQHVDDPDTEYVNEADGTIRCRVYGMVGARDSYLYLPRFSTIPNTNFGLFEVGFQDGRASVRYAVFDLATGSTLWDSSDFSFERTHGFRYVPQLNQFLLSGESADEHALVAAVRRSDGELLWQQEIDFLDRFKFVGTPNNAQVLVYGKTDGGQRTLVSIGLTDGVEQWRVEGFLRNDARNRTCCWKRIVTELSSST